MIIYGQKNMMNWLSILRKIEKWLLSTVEHYKIKIY